MYACGYRFDKRRYVIPYVYANHSVWCNVISNELMFAQYVKLHVLFASPSTHTRSLSRQSCARCRVPILSRVKNDFHYSTCDVSGSSVGVDHATRLLRANLALKVTKGKAQLMRSSSSKTDHIANYRPSIYL